jgi:trimeric autotransporter adhesin
MALILKDRVKESSSSSGTGNITLGGAFPGYQTFNTAIASGSTVYYTIHNLAAGFDTEWEVGVGTFTSPAILARNTVLSSSTGSLINFTAGTNGLEVFITQPAEEAVYINNATGKVEANGNGANTISFTNINASNVVMVSGTISTNASNATDITNKTYVDGLFSTGITYHAPVLVESPTALTATYNQPGGAGNGVGATLTNSGANVALIIDGVSLSNTARVLVYQQSNAVQNGVYTVTNPGAPDAPGPGAAWVLTRATDADTYGVGDPNKLGQGDAFFVQSGNTGAGETYILNTVGTITFGTTNLTFAQISSAQIYAAGTGLNLSNLTFSIANTTVVSGLYGDSANVSVIEVNAQGQLTSAANSAINVSNITVGTLSNDRTTASASNGANTIVLRDTNGSFNANVGTFTTVNATNGNFTNITANASGLTDINASNITSGTISNARTTGNSSNSASTLVLRDTNGAFEAGNVTASNFIGAGTTITSINASNISSGTIANARTTAASANGASTIVLRDAGGNFTANTITANIAGDISGGTNINASNITSGTINNARTTASSANGASTIVLRDVNGSFDANVVNATNLSGGGTLITSMNASNLSAGTVPVARVSGSYTGITGVGTVTAGTWQGNVIATTYGGTNLSSFTANGVVYASSTTALATGSGFVYDGTNVGIGTSSPSSLLNLYRVSGATTLTLDSGTAGTVLQYNAAGVAKYSVEYVPSSDFYSIGRSGVAYDLVLKSGNVGIGTTAPTSTAGFVPRLQLTSSASTALVVTSTATTQQNLIGTNGSGLFIESVGSATGTDNNIIFRNTSTNSNYSGNERMRITSGGNVGIGTTTPDFLLEVKSNNTPNQGLKIWGASPDGTKNSNIYFGDNAGTNAYVMRFVNVFGGGSGEAYGLNLRSLNTSADFTVIAGTEASPITGLTLKGNSGNVGIGTSSPASNLHIAGTTSAVVSRISATTGAPYSLYTNSGSSFFVGKENSASGSFGATAYASVLYEAGAYPMTFWTNAAERMRLSSVGGFSVGTTSDPGAGAIYATGNITAFFSDQRLKTVSGKIENALDKVKSLSGVYYTMNDVAKSHGYDSDETQVGVLAQEVEAVLPEIVKPAPFDLDENNNSKSGENYKTVQYEKLVPLLIEAIKELEAQVAELKAR